MFEPVTLCCGKRSRRHGPAGLLCDGCGSWDYELVTPEARAALVKKELSAAAERVALVLDYNGHLFLSTKHRDMFKPTVIAAVEGME